MRRIAIHVTLIAATLLGASALRARGAWALMPPHVRESFPRNGGLLSSDTVWLLGYSLSYADWKRVSVEDLTRNTPVSFTHKLDCKWVGQCKSAGMVGCRQQRCEARLHLASVEVGHRYQLRIERTTLTFTASPISVTLQKVGIPPTGRVCYDYHLTLKNRGSRPCAIKRIDIWLKGRRVGSTPAKPIALRPGATHSFGHRSCGGTSIGLLSRTPPSVNAFCTPRASNR